MTSFIFAAILLSITPSFAASGSAPMTLNAEGYVTIPCTLAAQQGTCLLDTGSAMSMIQDTELTKALIVVGQETNKMKYSTTSVDVVVVPGVDIGIGTVRNGIMERTNNFYGLPENLGMIGADVLRGQDLAFDFAKRMNPGQMAIYTFGAPARAAIQQGIHGRMLPTPQHIAIEVFINGTPVKAVWDTHFGTTSFSKQFIAAHGDLFVQNGTRDEADAQGGTGTTPLYALQTLVNLGNNLNVSFETVGTIDFAGLGIDADMIIGMDAIYQFTWFFDATDGVYSVILGK